MSRRSVLFFVLALTFACPLEAQTSFGLRSGVAVTCLYSRPSSAAFVQQYEEGFSLPFGLSVNHSLNSRFSVQVNAGYQPSGAILLRDKHIVAASGSTQRQFTDCPAEIRLHYLSLSGLLRYRVPVGKEFSLFVQMGPQQQLLLTAQEVDKGYGNVYNFDGSTAVSQRYFDERSNIRADFRTVNFGLGTDIGLLWLSGSEFATAEFGCSRGMTSVERDVNVKGAHVTGLFYVAVSYGFSLQPQSSKVCKR